jgi:hypothetical protein
MSNEIIQSVAYDNYDDFQHVKFIYIHNKSVHYFEDYFLMKLSFKVRY